MLPPNIMGVYVLIWMGVYVLIWPRKARQLAQTI